MPVSRETAASATRAATDPALLARVTELARARRELEMYRADRKSRLARWEVENRALLEACAAAERAVDQESAAVRAMAAKVFADTGDTRPAPGVGIRLKKRFGYILEAAVAWAKKAELPGLIVPEQLNVKAFEKLTAVGELPFVTITTEPQVTITEDLDLALDDAVREGPLPYQPAPLGARVVDPAREDARGHSGEMAGFEPAEGAES